MAIYIGTTLISEASTEGISLGTSDINEVYVGTNMVWQRAADADGTAEYQNQSTTTSGGSVSGTVDINVSSYAPSTSNYADSTLITQSQTYQVRTDYNDYVNSIVDICTMLTAPIGSGSPGVCVNPSNAIGGTNSYTQNVPRASTVGSVQTRTRQVYGTGGPIFYSGDATFTGNVTSLGSASVTASGSSIQSLVINPTSFALQSSARTETITFTYRPANSFFNSGTTFSGSVQVTVPAQMPLFGDADWTGVVNVSASGNPTATAGNGSPVTMLTGGFGTVTTDTNRDVTTRVTVPSGYSNFGQTVDITRTVVQPATIATSTVTFIIVDSISGATVSSVSPKTGNVGDAFSLYATASASTDHTFDSLNNASTSITPSGLGAGTPSINTTFDTWSRLITGTYPTNDTTYTITISGTCPSDNNYATAGTLFPSTISFTENGGSQSQAMSVSVTDSSTGTWTLSRSGSLSIGISSTSGTGNATVTVSYSGFGSASSTLTLKGGSTTLDTTTTSSGGGGQE